MEMTIPNKLTLKISLTAPSFFMKTIIKIMEKTIVTGIKTTQILPREKITFCFLNRRKNPNTTFFVYFLQLFPELDFLAGCFAFIRAHTPFLHIIIICNRHTIVQNKAGNHTSILSILWNSSTQSLLPCTATPSVMKDMRWGLFWKGLLVSPVFKTPFFLSWLLTVLDVMVNKAKASLHLLQK